MDIDLNGVEETFKNEDQQKTEKDGFVSTRSLFTIHKGITKDGGKKDIVGKGCGVARETAKHMTSEDVGVSMQKTAQHQQYKSQ